MASSGALFIDNDTAIELLGLKDVTTNKIVTDAVVQANLYDSSNEIVAGPLTLTFVPNSKGNYRTILPGTTELVENKKYKLVIKVTAPIIGSWENTYVALVRR